jgi:DNA-binding GntR family transcriptional regulator
MPRSESITDDLRRDILAGQFPPGERLVEMLLTERYDCGRAAIRSALVELASEGLVDREANRGAAVRRISIDEAIEITEARAALESLIAAVAARKATPDDRIELSDLIGHMNAAVAADDHVRYGELNKALHTKIWAVAQHTIAAHLVENLQNRAAHHQYRLALMPGRPRQSIDQHRAIVDAIVDGDEQAAAEAMRAHLQSVIDVLGSWGDADRG